MSQSEIINKFINALGKPATFKVSDEPAVVGYVTAVQINAVDGEPTVFIGGNYDNIEGVVLTYFNPSEVTLS